MPTMMPAYAVSGGGQMAGAQPAAAVKLPVPGPAGPVGNAMAMSGKVKGSVPEKGRSFRGGKKKSRDKWYGYNNKEFQRWWHRKGKEEWGGGDIEDAAMAKQVYDYWVEAGRPTVK